MSTLSERLMKVALLGVVPDDDQHVIADANAEIERLRALLNDRTYIRCKADYNRGHLSHAHYLNSKERGLGLADEQSAHEKSVRFVEGAFSQHADKDKSS